MISVEKGLWMYSDVTHHLGGTDHEDPLDLNVSWRLSNSI
ncbi:hypothetical protein M2370_004423 [Bacillus sp. JUb91]|nr:hypothetical protein [Bacillus sp. JUb91]